MKKLTDEEVKTLNRFDEYYKHLCNSKKKGMDSTATDIGQKGN